MSIGLENGFIELWKVPQVEGSDSVPEFVYAIPQRLSHASTVKKIAWRPFQEDSLNGSMIFATCSSDNGCRIFKVSNATLILP